MATLEAKENPDVSLGAALALAASAASAAAFQVATARDEPQATADPEHLGKALAAGQVQAKELSAALAAAEALSQAGEQAPAEESPLDPLA